MQLTLWEELLDRSTTEPCQMQIETDHPCPRPVTTELWSVPFVSRAPASKRRTSPVASASPGRYTGYGRISAGAPQ